LPAQTQIGWEVTRDLISGSLNSWHWGSNGSSLSTTEATHFHFAKTHRCRHLPDRRILRHDPTPNDTPEPNPGHVGPTEEETITRLISAGVRYFETNNEPDLVANWKHNATPGDAIEAQKSLH
jgi:hypothetical protein